MRTGRRPGLLERWLHAVARPSSVVRSLPSTGPPTVGLAAVVTRFAVQDLVETVPLALLGRRPFMPATVPIAAEKHYRAQALFLPVFGLGTWLLMGGAAQAVLRLSGQGYDVRRVLDVIGVGMLIPMPPLWLADVSLIAADRFEMPALGFVNVPAQVWETALFAIGLHVRGVPRGPASLAAVAASSVYVLAASRVVR